MLPPTTPSRSSRSRWPERRATSSPPSHPPSTRSASWAPSAPTSTPTTGPRTSRSYEFTRDIFDAYSAILGTVYDTTSTLATTLDEADLRNGVEINDAGARQTEASAQIVRWILLGQLTGQQDDPEFRRQVTRLGRAQQQPRKTPCTTAWSAIYEPAREGPLDTGQDSEFIAEANRFIETGEADVDVMLAVVNSTDESGAEIDSAPDIAARILDDEADSRLDAAVRRQWIFVGLAAGIVGLALLVTWLASRSITRPLRSLRTQADEMATSGCPTLSSRSSRHRRGRTSRCPPSNRFTSRPATR